MFTENTFEQAVIELLQGLGYAHIYAPDLNREDFSEQSIEFCTLKILFFGRSQSTKVPGWLPASIIGMIALISRTWKQCGGNVKLARNG